VIVKCANAIYANGKLTIPALDVPGAFNQNTTYQVTMDDVLFSNPFEFELSSATITVGHQDARTRITRRATASLQFLRWNCRVGQYNVNLLVVPGANPMRFRLRDATVK